MKFLLFFLSLVVFNFSAKAQTGLLTSYFKDIRNEKNAPIPLSVWESANANAVIAELAPFLSDSSEKVRSKSLAILKEIGLKSTNTAVRKKSTNLIARHWSKEGMSVYTALKQFAKKDFDKDTKDSLTHFLKKPYPMRSELIRIIGFIGDNDDVENIRLFSTKENPSSVRWSSLLAMSRLGDTEAINSVLQRARKLKVNDELVRQLLPDLVYTRHKQAMDYLIEILKSDKPDCESADNDNPTPILCGYRVMEQLAPAIKDYPLELDASGDIKTKDYKKSLESVRNWFLQNKGNYSINDSMF